MAKMNIGTLIRTASALPKNISILMRGRTGIGKSQIVRQLATKWGFTGEQVIDRRLAQMSEGDMVGLPSTDGNVTRFNPPDWYKRACNEPCVLFLDELNRATPEVMQAAFQIVLDRELNGWRLHEDTRIFSAVNTGSEYVVNEIDPALLRRFWAVDLETTKADWINWANDRNLNKVLIDFIDQNPTFLHAPEGSNVDDVQPTPASWERLNDSLVHAGVIDSPEDPVFKSICLGFVGIEATSKYVEHARLVALETNISAEDVMNKYKTIKPKIEGKLSKEKWASLTESVGVWCRSIEKEPTKKQLENLVLFLTDTPIELRNAFISKLAELGTGEGLKVDRQTGIKYLGKFWKEIKHLVIEVYKPIAESKENK